MVAVCKDVGKSSDPISVEVLVGLARDLGNSVLGAAEKGESADRVERSIWRQLIVLGLAALKLFVQSQGNGDMGETITTDEGATLHRSPTMIERIYRTIFGTITWLAYTYSAPARHGASFRPLDTRMSLPKGRFSYFFQEISQMMCVDKSFGDGSQAFASLFDQAVSVDSLERTNQQMGAQAETFMNSLSTPPTDQEGKLLVVTADGKGVPMIREDAQKVPLLEKPERPGNRRMATLGSVYSVDPYPRTPEQIVEALFRDDDSESTSTPDKRPQPKFKRLVANFSHEVVDGPETITMTGAVTTFNWIREQVEHRRQPNQIVIRLMDGQPSLWEAADLCMEEIPTESIVDILDIVHAAGYVWKAANVLHKSKEHREACARDYLLRILKGQVRAVTKRIRQMAEHRQLKGEAAKTITKVCNYFKRNARRMRYHRYLAAGYPIATGVIEGACRHLVKDRLERSGMRWTLAGAQAMLNVRCAYHSTSWQEFNQTRIDTDQKQNHPHRHLLKNYKVDIHALCA